MHEVVDLARTVHPRAPDKILSTNLCCPQYPLYTRCFLPSFLPYFPYLSSSLSLSFSFSSLSRSDEPTNSTMVVAVAVFSHGQRISPFRRGAIAQTTKLESRVAFRNEIRTVRAAWRYPAAPGRDPFVTNFPSVSGPLYPIESP